MFMSREENENQNKTESRQQKFLEDIFWIRTCDPPSFGIAPPPNPPSLPPRIIKMYDDDGFLWRVQQNGSEKTNVQRLQLIVKLK